MPHKISPLLIAKKIEEDIAYVIKYLFLKTNKKPKLTVILCGNKPESQIYVKRKMDKSKELGIKIDLIQIPEDQCSKSAIIDIIGNLNNDNDNDAILLQLPLPDIIKEHTFQIVNAISSEKDIDGLTTSNIGLLNGTTGDDYNHSIIESISALFSPNSQFCHAKDRINLRIAPKDQSFNPFDATQDFNYFCKNFKLESSQALQGALLRNFLMKLGTANAILPCTPLGIIFIIKNFFKDEPLAGKTATIFGDSNLVGRPIARILLKHKITVSICNSKTQNGDFFSKNSDIIILATGQKNHFGEKFFNQYKRQLICDVGISPIPSGSITGDLCEDLKHNKNFEHLYYTPVPFGIGRMTINSIMLNILLIFLSNLIKQNKI